MVCAQVVIRNTVPFLTALCERVALKKPMDMMLILALLVTFLGTVLYSETWRHYHKHVELLSLTSNLQSNTEHVAR